MFCWQTKLLHEAPLLHVAVRLKCGGRTANGAAFIGLIIALWLGSEVASGQVLPVPPGLSAGAKYRLVFVTDYASIGLPGVRDATSADILDYNSFVTTYAETSPALAALRTTWTAIASTAAHGSVLAVSARDNTSTNYTLAARGIPIYTVLGARVASDYADLWNGTIESPINVNQYGSRFTGFGVWTGTTTDGYGASNAALGLPKPIPTDPASWAEAMLGYASVSDPNWISSLTQKNNLSRRFYAMSGELTAVPEPSSLALGCALAVAGVAWCARRRKRNPERSTPPVPS